MPSGGDRDARLMCEQHLQVRRKKRRRSLTRPGRGRWRAPDLIGRDCTAGTMNQKWFGDGSKLTTSDEGKLYLSLACSISAHGGSWGSPCPSGRPYDEPRLRHSLGGDGLRVRCSMNRSGWLIVLLAGGLLTVAACDRGQPVAHGGGTAAPGTGTAGPTAHASARSGVREVPDRVRIGRYTQEFATPVPADPASAKVIEGFREAQVLWIESAIARRLVAPVRDYVTGVVLTHLKGTIAGERQENFVPTGRDRFFMTRVTAVTGTTATVATCEDSSKFRLVNPRTGHVDSAMAASPDQQYFFGRWQMVLVSGHWAISALSPALLPDARARPCQP